MGRPAITLTPEQVREVETLAALLNQDQIADYFGISRNTFRAICGRDDEVAARYRKGKAKAIAHVANSLLQKARAGDTTSAIFYLKTHAGWREPDIHDANTDGYAGPTIDASQLKGDTLQDLMTARQRLQSFLEGKNTQSAEMVATPVPRLPGSGKGSPR